MRIHLTAFAISLTAVFSIFMLVITIWTRLSTSFGGEFMLAFQSIHPNPYGANNTDLTILEQVMGGGLDFFYAATDALILSLAFGSLYNFLVQRLTLKDSE